MADHKFAQQIKDFLREKNFLEAISQAEQIKDTEYQKRLLIEIFLAALNQHGGEDGEKIVEAYNYIWED